MTGEKEIALVRRFIDEVNRRNYDVVDEVFSPAFVAQGSVEERAAAREGRGPDGTRERLKENIAAMVAAFPDLLTVVEDILSDGSKVAVRGVLTGTQTGPFGGLAPGGRSMRIRFLDIYAVRDGLLAEMWSVTEFEEMFSQLRPLPPGD